MKIKLHYIHPNNYGNLMMASAFIENFVELSRDNNHIEFYIDNENEEELERLNNSLEKKLDIKIDNRFSNKKVYTGLIKKINKLVNLIKEISHNKHNFDCHVYLGGDCISEYYGIREFIIDIISMKLISKKSKVFLVGQTMGPFSGYRISLAKNCLKDCYIYTRDDNCFNYLKDILELKNIYKSRDLAFLDIPHQNNSLIKKQTLDKFKCNEEYITIVASGLIGSYTSNEEAYINEYIKIIEYIIQNTSYKVLLLAHVIHNPASDDTRAINEIMDKILDEYKNRIIVVDKLIMPHEARILLGEGIMTITGRMHAAVSSLNMGIVPLCLSYSVKYKGVVGIGFNLKDLIIECRNDSIWENEEVSKLVIEKIKYILDNKVKLKKDIKERLEITKRKSLQQIDEVIKILHN